MIKNRKNIVLLHGWGAETKKLEPLKKELTKLGWNVFLPKLAGFEKPAPKEVWGIKEYSEFVLEESKKKFENNKFVIFGHSFGGGITIKLAAGNVKNLEGLVLCASRGISRGKTIKRFVFAVLAKAGIIFLVTPKLANNFRKLLYKAAREHDYEKTEGIMREIFRKVVSEDLKPILAKVKVSVLILWGDEDKMTPLEDAFYITKAISGSKLVIYKNQHHNLPYVKPVNLAEEINSFFINRK